MADLSTNEKLPLLESQTDTEAEPTLAELEQNVRTAQRAYMRAWSKSTSGKWQKRIMYSVTALITLVFVCFIALFITVVAEEDDWSPPQRVPLEAHIMSKCPDARDCLHDMILPAMMNVSHKVDFKLSYIGTLTNEDDGVICKHGQEECLGNILELCAARLYPDPKVHLGFTYCLTKDFADIPAQSLVEDCALEHGINFQRLNSCAVEDDGAMGMDLLRASVERSQKANVTKSCTVRLDGKVRCIRDGGKWTDCEEGHTAGDLVEDVNALWHASMHRGNGSTT